MGEEKIQEKEIPTPSHEVGKPLEQKVKPKSVARRDFLRLLGLGLIATACGQARLLEPTSEPTETFPPTPTPEPTTMPTASPTPEPTTMPESTATPQPTATQTPTPEPTATPGPDSTTSNTYEIQEKTERATSLIQHLAPIYLDSAERNKVSSVRGEVIIPSPPYRNGIYCRDALWATLGLDNLSLMHNCYRWFEETQLNNGQIRSAVAFSPEDHSLQPQDDESTLLFLIWAGILKRKGTPINIDVANKALGFIRAHIKEGYYASPPGPFRYWLDTLSQGQETRISYNQGLWGLSLRFAQEIGLPISREEINLARESYRSGYQSRLGFVSQSRETNWQDVSSLLPEFLSRWLFSEKVLADEMVVATVDHHFKMAGIYQAGELVGIKNISHPDGSFLSPGAFAIRRSEKGDYQNGGYWPMYTLVELCLAYEVTNNPKYENAVARLMEMELKDGRGAKEFLSLRPGRVGSYPPETAGYSWNALVYQALRWSGLLK